MNKFVKILVPIVLVLGPAAWMTFSAVEQNTITCDVCVLFKGQANCVTATGETNQTCQRTATDNACGVLASGVQQSIQCSQKPPTSVKFY